MERLESFSQKKVVLRFLPLLGAPEGKRNWSRIKPAAGFVILAGTMKESGGLKQEFEFSIFDGPEFKIGDRYACQIDCPGIGKWEGEWTIERTSRLTERSLIVRMESAPANQAVTTWRTAVTEDL